MQEHPHLPKRERQKGWLPAILLSGAVHGVLFLGLFTVFQWQTRAEFVYAELWAPEDVSGGNDPTGVAERVEAPEQVIEVIVYPDARLSLRSGKTLTPVDMPGLVDGVKALQADHPEIPVVIAADKTVRYEEVVNVMKTLQSADVQRVGLSLRIERSADAR